jgi:threonine/homoserine/homoserine lactone efflux protein
MSFLFYTASMSTSLETSAIVLLVSTWSYRRRRHAWPTCLCHSVVVVVVVVVVAVVKLDLRLRSQDLPVKQWRGDLNGVWGLEF